MRPGSAQEVHGGVPAGVRAQERDGVWRGPGGAAPRPAARRALRGGPVHGRDRAPRPLGGGEASRRWHQEDAETSGLVWPDLCLSLALTGRVPHQRVQTSHPEAVPGLGEPEGAGGPLRTLPARHHLHPEAVLQGGTVCLFM